jgi:hypothetical protein
MLILFYKFFHPSWKLACSILLLNHIMEIGGQYKHSKPNIEANQYSIHLVVQMHDILKAVAVVSTGIAYEINSSG